MLKTLRQICRTGIITEPAPVMRHTAGDDALQSLISHLLGAQLCIQPSMRSQTCELRFMRSIPNLLSKILHPLSHPASVSGYGTVARNRKWRFAAPTMRRRTQTVVHRIAVSRRNLR